MKVDAVVLAGRYNQGKLRGVSDEILEANIEVAGKPMVRYVLDALEGAPQVNAVYLVGPREELGRYESPRINVVESGEDVVDNICRGLDKCTTEYVLVSTSDIPLVTVSVVEDLIEKFASTGADFCYPVCLKEDVEARYPGARRTYARVKEGTFTGGNVFFVRKEIVPRTLPMLKTMIAHRKSPLKMASLLGWRLLIKVLLGTAGIPQIEKRVSDILGIVPRAIVGAPVEVGVDVDKPEDYDLCSRVLLAGKND